MFEDAGSGNKQGIEAEEPIRVGGHDTICYDAMIGSPTKAGVVW
jgi:hypothetical protein